jgi:hypothetical protein
MKTIHRRFIIQLLIISIVLYGIVYGVSLQLTQGILPITAMIALLFAVNSIAFIFVTNTKEKNPSGFVYSYMTVSFGRMIFCGAFVFLYALMHRQGARAFALTFFALYFIYTIIEVRAIYGFFKN